MPRLPRYAPSDIPQHVIQRGNDRQPCFLDNVDCAVFLACLDRAQHCVDIHAWVLMTNHVHLLASPRSGRGLSAMMQCIGRNYVSWFNHRHQRTGTLWEGRFKSCPVDSERYLLRCYNYIEANPVRAGMVRDPAQYEWSSFRCNAWGGNSRVVVPHALYLALGKSSRERADVYRAMFRSAIDDTELLEIRASVNTGMVLGGESFKNECELRCGRRLRPAARGRPRREDSGAEPPVSAEPNKEKESDPN